MSLDFSTFSEDGLRKLIKLVEIKETRVRFALNHHRNTSGEKMEFTRFRHMLDLYHSVSPKIIVVGASQTGKTDWLIIDTFAAAFNNVPVFFVLPKIDFLKTYCKEKVQTPISRSPEYKAITKGAISESIELLQFGNAMIKFVGGNVPSDFVSFSAGQYVIDEIDQCDSDDNIELGYSRLKGSIFRFERLVSNPTTKDGRIWKEYLKSDQRVWVCPCDKCGRKSHIDWFDSVIEELEDDSGNVISNVLRDKEWHPGIGRDIYIKCPIEGCDGNLDRFHKDCGWEAQNPDSPIEGYHMPSLVSPLNSVSGGWAEYREGLQNPSKMAAFYSMFLALPYAPIGSKISVNLLSHCVGEDNLQYTVKCSPDNAQIFEETHEGPCSMGIDTSPNHVDVRISSMIRGKRKLVYVGKIDAKTQGREAVEAKLHYLVEMFNVQAAVIDIGPEKLLALDFQRNADCPVWLCKFLGRGGDRSLQKFNYTDMIISIDRTEAIDRAYSQLKTGRNLLPENFGHILNGVYSSEMTALVREVTEDRQGNLKYSWTSGNDHAFLADTYDLLAFDTLQEDLLVGEQSIFIG